MNRSCFLLSESERWYGNSKFNLQSCNVKCLGAFWLKKTRTEMSIVFDTGEKFLLRMTTIHHVSTSSKEDFRLILIGINSSRIRRRLPSGGRNIKYVISKSVSTDVRVIVLNRARLSQSGDQVLLQFGALLLAYILKQRRRRHIMKCIFAFVWKKYCYNSMEQGKTSELKSYPDLKYNLYSLCFKD